MRYDWVLDKLLKEKSRHELAIQKILRRAVNVDCTAAEEILKAGKRGPYKKKTGMSEKARKNLSKKMKAIHAAKKVTKN